MKGFFKKTMETSGNIEKFVRNGFLVVEAKGYEGYLGVCGYTWPLSEENIEERLVIPDNVQNSVAVATNWKNTYEYWQRCLDKKLNTRLLLIETILDYPKIEISVSQVWELIGYDVSYVEGDFYSAIQQEVMRAKGSVFPEWKKKLNRFGLYDKYQDASDFLSDRSTANPHDVETGGEFFVVRVSRYKGEK